ncbi:50S ribosomal protein L29 [Candidatus Wolfebacteria bacterium]|nr:50S ribosomal protein L29 [Candidatus Wolfebacteria bacterium]
MKKSELQKLRDKNVVDLSKEVKEDKDRLWQLRMDLASGKIKNISEIRKLRAKIATTNTLMSEKNNQEENK